MLLSLTALQTALEVGAIYSLVALALFISFSILNIADLSTDGCYTLGFAVGATVTLAGHPLLALPAAMAAGACSGFVTAFLQTRLGVESILAGCLIGQLNKSCDINLGTGMVTVALASLVIGESLMGRGSIARRVFGVVLGAVLYRLIIAVAISTKIVPTEGFKLVSALIVAVAIATPYGRKMVALQKQKLAAKKKREGAKVC